MQTCIREAEKKHSVNQFNMHSILSLAKYFASNYIFVLVRWQCARAREEKQKIKHRHWLTDAGQRANFQITLNFSTVFFSVEIYLPRRFFLHLVIHHTWNFAWFSFSWFRFWLCSFVDFGWKFCGIMQILMKFTEFR